MGQMIFFFSFPFLVNIWQAAFRNFRAKEAAFSSFLHTFSRFLTVVATPTLLNCYTWVAVKAKRPLSGEEQGQSETAVLINSINCNEYDCWFWWKQQSFAKRNAIFCLFSVPLITRSHINWLGTRAVPGKQKASFTELLEDNSTNNSSSDINEISVFGKGKCCFDGLKRYFIVLTYFVVTSPKGLFKIVRLITQRKKLWLSIWSGQKKKFWWLKEISIFLVSTWNLY